jgi:hypothetical protein
MERHKTVDQMRFSGNPLRFWFGRKASGKSRFGLGDLRVSKRDGKTAASSRVDVRLRARAAEVCGLSQGDPVEMFSDYQDGQLLFELVRSTKDAGMILHANSKSSSNDLRLTFTVENEVVCRLFGDRKAFACDLVNTNHNGNGFGRFLCTEEV